MYAEFEEKHNGRICPEHMYYDPKQKIWQFRYDSIKCAKHCHETFCPVRNSPISKKKGNVFYDLHLKRVRKDDTFFSGEPMISIIKGKRFLDRPASIDICREIAKTAAKKIREKEWWNGYSMEHIYNKDLEIEIQNIRAEAKESRDLLQDLEDIRNGITVVHESDRKQAEKVSKRERKQERQKKRIQSLQRKLVKIGFQSLSAEDRRIAQKLFTKEQLAAFERERQNVPIQISIFDDD